MSNWPELYLHKPAPAERALLSRELLAILPHVTIVMIAAHIDTAMGGQSPFSELHKMGTARIVDELVRMCAAEVVGGGEGVKTNHRKDEMGVHGCEYAVSMVEHLPIEHDDHEHYIGYVRSTLRWQASRIVELEALLKAAESKDGGS